MHIPLYEIAEYAIAQVAALIVVLLLAWTCVKVRGWRQTRRLRWAQHDR